MSKFERCFVAVLLVLAVSAGIFFATPVGVTVLNHYGFAMHKADDATSYDTLKKVEDSCRGLIATYEADKLMYEQYKDSEDKEKQGWAEQAKIRANRAAANYNAFYLKNSFVWADAVPADICSELPYLE